MSEYGIESYAKFAKQYNRCMEALSNVYCRWYGSAYGLTHSDVRHMYDLVSSGKTSITRYCHELNDKIFFDQYGEHLYKDCQGKDVNSYVL